MYIKEYFLDFWYVICGMMLSSKMTIGPKPQGDHQNETLHNQHFWRENAFFDSMQLDLSRHHVGLTKEPKCRIPIKWKICFPLISYM